MLKYDEVYPVERYDAVDVEINGRVYAGVVIRLYPRLGEVQVRYEDDLYTTRAGDPLVRSTRVSVNKIALLAKDG